MSSSAAESSSPAASNSAAGNSNGRSGSQPRWLDADERAAWLNLAGVMIKLPAALDAQLQRDAGLSYFEYMVLAMLSEQPDRTMRMSRLAILTNGSLSRLSHVAKRLENQGLLRRESCPEDGRYTNAILTDSGHDKVVAAAPGHVTAVRALVIDALTTSQHAQLGAIGERILRRIDPDDTCRSPG
jgi:DNA-binding MarR family transcriptional regulator